MKEAEQGWERAMDKIGERASLAKFPVRGNDSSPLLRGIGCGEEAKAASLAPGMSALPP